MTAAPIQAILSYLVPDKTPDSDQTSRQTTTRTTDTQRPEQPRPGHMRTRDTGEDQRRTTNDRQTTTNVTHPTSLSHFRRILFVRGYQIQPVLNKIRIFAGPLNIQICFPLWKTPNWVQLRETCSWQAVVELSSPQGLPEVRRLQANQRLVWRAWCAMLVQRLWYDHRWRSTSHVMSTI